MLGRLLLRVFGIREEKVVVTCPTCGSRLDAQSERARRFEQHLLRVAFEHDNITLEEFERRVTP